nr:copper resistance protein CopC [Prescottella equi]
PTIQGDTASVPLEGLGRWASTRSRSRDLGDGHPVSGTRVFTLTQEGTGVPGPKAGGQDASSSSDGDSDSNMIIWVIVGVAVVVFGGGLWFALRKPRGEN